MRVSDVTNRAKRDVMARVPVVRELVDRRDRARLAEHRPRLPAVGEGDRRLLQRLDADGVVVTDLDALAVEGTGAMWRGLLALTQDLAADAGEGAATVRPSRERLLEQPAVWRWGLDERLLDVVEHHIGLPVRYYGADVRCERADGEAFGVRQWHRDCEDHRMFKVLVWLSDVGPDDGPFEHVPREATERATRRLRYVSGYVPDERLSRLVPPEQWRQAVGPAGTAVVADTVTVFHRARPPVARDRWSVTYTWTSRTPQRTFPPEAYPQDLRAGLLAGLSERQVACLPPVLAPVRVPAPRRGR